MIGINRELVCYALVKNGFLEKALTSNNISLLTTYEVLLAKIMVLPLTLYSICMREPWNDHRQNLLSLNSRVNVKPGDGSISTHLVPTRVSGSNLRAASFGVDAQENETSPMNIASKRPEKEKVFMVPPNKNHLYGIYAYSFSGANFL